MAPDTRREAGKLRPAGTRSDAPEATGPAGGERALFVLSLVGLAVLAFLAGTIVMRAGVFPAPQVDRAYRAAVAWKDSLTGYRDVYATDLWYPARRDDTGVTVLEPGGATGGPTLYTSGHAPAAVLIDREGRVLHEWQRAFSTVWPEGERPIADPQPDSHVFFRMARAFPNGDLLALYEAAGDTPYGYGLVKLDRNSDVLWAYTGRAHHQFDIAPDGRIFALTHGIFDDELDYLGHLERPRLEDELVVLTPDGEETARFRLLTALAASPYRQMIYTLAGFALGDPLHANAVEYVDAEKAARFAFAEEGDVLLSFRELHALAVLDPESGAITWALRGPWIGQHDPDILDTGDILLFDNFGNYDTASGFSRVIEVDPRTAGITWQYAGTPEAPFVSRIRSDQQRLPDGNTLITESNGGRLLEVTRDGRIVWEFVNPVRGGEDDAQIPVIAWAERYEPGQLRFLDVP